MKRLLSDSELAAALRIVRGHARDFYRQLLPEFRVRYGDEDLVQEGSLVLVRCWRTYCAARGVKFSTYLSRALDRHYRSLLRKELARKRSVYVRSVDFLAAADKEAGSRPSRDHRLRVEVLVDLQTVRRRVSGHAQALVDLVFELSAQTKNRSNSAVYGKFNLNVVSQHLCIGRRKAQRVVRELKTAMGR